MKIDEKEYNRLYKIGKDLSIMFQRIIDETVTINELSELEKDYFFDGLRDNLPLFP